MRTWAYAARRALIGAGAMAAVVAATAASAQEGGTIRGTVRAETTLRPLSGVQVSLPQTNQGTLTNSAGDFIIVNVAPGTHSVRVQMLGFTPEEHTVSVSPGQAAELSVELAEEALALDEIVVTGTVGQARRREVGNSISSVSARDLEIQPIMQAQDAITAQVPGTIVMSNEGMPGAGGSIRVRGINSLTQGNSPLIYVDGVRIYGSSMPGSALGQDPSALNNINPNDIERIEVIKGAAATTLYGTEASSGVIQIFTKSGSAGGGARWEVSMRQGVSRLPQIGPDTDSRWFEVWGENAGGLFMDQYTQDGRSQDYNLSVRGSLGQGPGSVNYYVSGGWSDETGVLPVTGQEMMTLRGNVGFQPIESLGITFNSSLSDKQIAWLPGGNLAKGFTLNVMRGPFDYTADADSVFFTEFDIVEDIRQFTSGLEFRFSPFEQLNSRLNLGLDFLDSDYQRSESFGSLLEPEGYRLARRWNNLNRTVDFQATYQSPFLGVTTSTSAGFQVYDSNRVTVSGTSERFAGPGSPTLDTGSQQNSSESRLREVNAGFFFQEMIGIADRLFLTGGVRMDGNSAFGSDYGLQVYPKLSASYVISDESFWPAGLETRLRAAFGESGKAPGYFDAERTWSPISAQDGQPGVTPSTRGNPLLGPERSRELEAGLEIGAFEGRLTFDGTMYRQRTHEALLTVPQDPTLGYLSSQIQNVGTIANRGWEFTINGVLVRSPSLTWEVGLSGSGNTSEMEDLGESSDVFLGGSLNPGIWVREGYPVPSFFLPVLQNPEGGVGEAPIVEEEFIGPAYPTQTFSLSTTLAVGPRLTVDARGEYQGGHYNLSHTAWRNAQRGVWPPCLEISQRANAEGVSSLTTMERFTCGNFSASEGAYISPADFFRLRSVGVSYRVPESWTPGFGEWTASLGARNLFIITDYIGLDPELNQGGNTLGRHEYYQTPTPRSLSVTLRAAF